MRSLRAGRSGATGSGPESCCEIVPAEKYERVLFHLRGKTGSVRRWVMDCIALAARAKRQG